MKTYFISGIGTDVGKTIASAIVVEAMKADYWKPIQSGDLDNTDTMKVQRLISNDRTRFHPEAYSLTVPMSPHASAALDGVVISSEKIKLPTTLNHLVIEGAGGLMVPLHHEFLILDLIQMLNAEVLLVSRNYLGSINHTLLSIDALKSRNIPIKGIIFNDKPVKSSEEFILAYSGCKCLFHIDQEDLLDKNCILKYARNSEIIHQLTK